MDVESILARIDDQYRRLGATDLSRLAPSSEAAIVAFAAQHGRALPDDYCRFVQMNVLRHPFDGGFECFALDDAADRWASLTRQLDEGRFAGLVEQAEPAGNWDSGKLRMVWWSTGWIPFAGDSRGNLRCLDLDPGPKGTAGQIIKVELQDGAGPFPTAWSSFTAFLEDHLALLEADKVRIDGTRLEVDRHHRLA